MSELTRRTGEVNGIRMHWVEQGTGPLVLLCHGFPESWYSWRNQLDALSRAGFRVVAPDMRGYGETEGPADIDKYTLLHLVGDMVGLVGALGESSAVIAGHDWGAPVAWYAALMRPDRFRAVIGLSVPFRPRAPAPPTRLMPAREVFYQLYSQAPGVAEVELERDVRASLERLYHAASGDAPPHQAGISLAIVPRQGGFLTNMAAPASRPPWQSEQDLAFFVEAFRASGFRRPLNWYGNIDRNWELLAPFAGARVSVPGALHGRHARHGGVVSRYGAVDRESGELRSKSARHDDVARLRALDAAGARRGSECGHDRISAGPVRWRPSAHCRTIAGGKSGLIAAGNPRHCTVTLSRDRLGVWVPDTRRW